MSDKSNIINNLVQKRISLIGELSQKNAEYLKMLQIGSGNDILLMKNPDAPDTIQSNSENNQKIELVMARINELEKTVAQLDRDIETALAEETGK